MRLIARLIVCLRNLSVTRKKILFLGIFVMVVATLIHNPFSGYRNVSGYNTEYYSLMWGTKHPIGISYKDKKWGYFDLGFQSVYISSLFGTTILVAMALFLADDKRE